MTELASAFPGLELKFLRGDEHSVAELLKKGDAELALAGAIEEQWDRLRRVGLFFRSRWWRSSARTTGSANRDGVDLQPLCERCWPGHIARPTRAQTPAVNDATRSHELVSDADLLQMVEANLGGHRSCKGVGTSARIHSIPYGTSFWKRTVHLYVVAGRARSPAGAALDQAASGRKAGPESAPLRNRSSQSLLDRRVACTDNPPEIAGGLHEGVFIWAFAAVLCVAPLGDAARADPKGRSPGALSTFRIGWQNAYDLDAVRGLLDGRAGLSLDQRWHAGLGRWRYAGTHGGIPEIGGLEVENQISLAPVPIALSDDVAILHIPLTLVIGGKDRPDRLRFLVGMVARKGDQGLADSRSVYDPERNAVELRSVPGVQRRTISSPSMRLNLKVRIDMPRQDDRPSAPTTKVAGTGETSRWRPDTGRLRPAFIRALEFGADPEHETKRQRVSVVDIGQDRERHAALLGDLRELRRSGMMETKCALARRAARIAFRGPTVRCGRMDTNGRG